MGSQREQVNLEDAMHMIPESEYIHTFRFAGGLILIGADWARKELFEHMDKHGVELSGPTAASMAHALCVIDDYGPLFIETKREDS